jgi:hypothetical protein
MENAVLLTVGACLPYNQEQKQGASVFLGLI